jgi:hypothetical protein
LKQIIDNLFKPLEVELTQRVRGNCLEYPKWQVAISGSLKEFRRNNQTLKLDLALHQAKFTMHSPALFPQVPKFIGDGNIYLSLPQLSPTLKCSVLSFPVPREMEQLPSHVSYLMSDSYDTQAETSEWAPFRNPFPESCQENGYIRLPEEENLTDSNYSFGDQ